MLSGGYFFILQSLTSSKTRKFQTIKLSQLHKAKTCWTENDLSDLSPKKIQKVLMKTEEMEDVFLNSANFASHAFLTLAPPSGYALNLKALIKVSKVS